MTRRFDAVIIGGGIMGCSAAYQHPSAADRAALEANVALGRRVGIRTELLSPKAVRQLVPFAETADLTAAAYEPESGYADPYLIVTAYAQAARRLGATVFPTEPFRLRRFAEEAPIRGRYAYGIIG